MMLDQKTAVAAFRAKLEKGDDETTFDHFLDLLVHTHYFKSLDYPIPSGRYSRYKCQPPITFVSRDTRRESPPLFYKSCVFSVVTMRALGILAWTFDTALCRKPSAFIDNTSIHNFARIKTFDLDFSTSRRG
jgi:hypothetical protein